MDLSSIRSFVQTADSRSFSGAALQLNKSQSGISKAITRLERELGATLLDRSTHSVMLTAEGELFLEHCRNILSEMQAARDSVASSSADVRGAVRFAVPLGLGRHVLVKHLPGFLERYPDLTPHFHFTSKFPDFRDDQIDAALWVGEIPDDRFIARLVGRVRQVTCASPAYLETNGEPKHPEELQSHSGVAYSENRTGLIRKWKYVVEGAQYDILPRTIAVGDGYDALCDLSIAGCGLVQAPNYIVNDQIRLGFLNRVLKEYDAPGHPIYLVYPQFRRSSPKILALIKLMFEALDNNAFEMLT